MKWFIFVVVCLSGCSSMREANHFESSTLGNRTSQITWKVVEDASTECEKLGSEKGAVACALFSKHSCTIITSKNTSHEILGHEARHCFEGKFHQ